MKNTLVVLLSLFLLGTICPAQTIQVSRDNKTIYVSSEGEAKSEPDIVAITIGYENFGATKDEAFEENVATSNRILDALFAAHLDKKQIETGNVGVSRVQFNEKLPPELRAKREFHARQSWTLHLAAEDAQGFLDIAVSAGANVVGTIAWDLRDRDGLQAKASRAALGKARLVADEMAKGLSAKLGALIYASNTAPIREEMGVVGGVPGGVLGGVIGGEVDVKKRIRLFPEKVTEKTTVYAVFAIE